ncbi:MAG: hypothetical protein GOV15_01595, partial [Candidatus Diapherotrites archaeon]|nr:hypothetical protein [Candidatus Diapherotrites archaeon]
DLGEIEQIVFKHLDKVKEELIDEKVFEYIKESKRNYNLIYDARNPGGLAVSAYERHKVGSDFLINSEKYYEEATPEDVMKAAKKYLVEKNMYKARFTPK